MSKISHQNVVGWLGLGFREGMFRRTLAIRGLMHNKNYSIIMAVYIGINLRPVKLLIGYFYKPNSLKSF
jgi:hypothetical protein